LINGERIEYLTIANNVLGTLKRATLGTAAKDYYPVGTTLVDQGRFQTIPFKETRNVYTTATTTATSYSFGNLGLNTTTNATDQVEVYYGGILLRKPTTSTNILTMHDSSIAFDSGEVNSLGISSDIVLEPQFTIAISGTNYTVNLNLDAITSGTNLVVVHTTATDWYDSNDSLINDRSIQANFLRDNPATLPDKYHYGQL
jgi:hypothetical protein